MLNIFWILAGSWLVYANKIFEMPNHISRLTYQNEVSVSFFFLLWRLLMNVLTVIISLYFNETKKNKPFYLHCSCQTLLSNQVRET